MVLPYRVGQRAGRGCRSSWFVLPSTVCLSASSLHQLTYDCTMMFMKEAWHCHQPQLYKEQQQPTEDAELKWVSLKSAFMLAITSEKKSGITTCSGNKLSLQSLLATWVHCDLCLNLSFMPRSYYQIVWTSWLTLQRSMKVNLQSVPCCMCSALLNISHMIQLFICHSGKMFV